MNAPIPMDAQAFGQPEGSILQVETLEVVESVNAFDQPIQLVEGVLYNSDANNAYTQITLSAQALDQTGAVIGEGIGVPVDACNAGVLPDYTLEPMRRHRYSIPLELYDPDALIAEVIVTPQAETIAPEVMPDVNDFSELAFPELPESAIRPLSNSEVVLMEWIDERTLRYAEGCIRDLFNQWTWYNYSDTLETSTAAPHPRQDALTDILRQRLALTDTLIFANAFIRFIPDGMRMVYQDAVNRFYTADADGRFIRQVHGRLNSYSLQGVYWLDAGRFIAYYYGAYGDPVIWFTADVEGRTISPSPLNNPPSVIIPGASSEGERVVIAGTFDEVTGYYIQVVNNGFFERLFEAEPPGINFPAPIPLVDAEQDRVNRVYVARQIGEVAVMQCFNRDENYLYNLAQLPLNLTSSDRAEWWLSPDGSAIALAANGAHGGLWWIDLAALPACESAAIPEITPTPTGG